MRDWCGAEDYGHDPREASTKGEGQALTEAVRTTTVPQQGNHSFLATGSLFPLTEGLLMGDPSPK